MVAAAAAKTSAASTARISETVTGSLNGSARGGGSLLGVVDGRRQRGAITFDFSFLAKAAGSVDPDALKGRMVFYGPIAFLTSPVLTGKLSGGKRWIEVTSSRLRNSSGVSGVGETIGGTLTKRYRTEVDYRRYLALVPASDRQGLRRAVDLVEQRLGSSKAPVEAWIAADGTIRRAKGTAEGKGVHLEYTIDLTAVGKPVNVSPPPPSAVFDGRKL